MPNTRNTIATVLSAAVGAGTGVGAIVVLIGALVVVVVLS